MITDVTDLEADLASFFWDHLKKDLRIIGKCLPRGENEVLMMLHRVVQHVAGMQPTTGRHYSIYRMYANAIETMNSTRFKPENVTCLVTVYSICL